MKRDSDRDARRPSDTEAIEATAAAWLAERDENLSVEDEVRFARWRAADARHEAAVVQLERAWTALQPLRDFRPEAQRHPDRDLLDARRVPLARVIPLSLRAAAAALAACLVVAAVWWVGGRRADSPAEQRHSTTVEGYERVTLEDGSMVELNSASEVTVHFTPGERRVRLVRGEAHFTVTKNKARPFVVEAAGVAVRAVGTAFNVRLGAREVEVLVTEGRVAVATPAATGDRGTELAANERAVIVAESVAGPTVERVAPAAVREALAWQGPRLVFSDTPLAEAIAQFNRRNAVQLELADSALSALPIGGSFRAENVEGFVRLLTAGNDLVVDRPDALRLVLGKAK